jgi:DNA-binding winged helix-turn-helix (wHTH) protein
MDALSSSENLLFGPFRFDRRDRLLFRHGEDGRYLPVNIGARALAVLEVLTERPGDLVSKDEIMQVAWNGLAVEEGNLTVQISTLRRILDARLEGESCIQTVSGRGYRFTRPVTYPGERSPAGEPAPTNDHIAEAAAGRASSWSWLWLAGGSGAVTIIVLGVAVMWLAGWPARTVVPPRLSLVVLPFQNLSGDPKDDYLADGITEDLISDLSGIPGALVIARESAYAFKSKVVDVRQIGAALGVRYVLAGSLRRIDDTLRVNASSPRLKRGCTFGRTASMSRRLPRAAVRNRSSCACRTNSGPA